MNKNTIVIVLVALVIGVGTAVFVAINSSENEVTPETTQQEAGPLGVGQQSELDDVDEEVTVDHTVVYGDNGYEPLEIRIQTGETVEFVNRSSRDVWTASDPHPQHTDLPAFDAQRAQAPGESYTFTFNEPGQWGFHNHVRSTDSGVVIVE